MQVFRNKKILVSLCFLAGLLVISLFFDGTGRQVVTLTGKNGLLLGSAPFSPSQVPPFGTDQLGFPILYLLLKGAKFTIGIAVISALIRLGFSVVIGVGLTLFPKWVQNGITRLVSPFYYLPVSLLTYILLVSVLFSSQSLQPTFTATMSQRMIFELLLLSFIGVPTLLIYFKDITGQLLLEEHIIASRVLGADPLTILRRHIWLGIRTRVVIQFVEQVIQVLILLVHLGMFRLLFGGTVIFLSPFNQKPPIYSSISSEWSGLIGSGYHELTLYPWLALDPLIAFAILIFAFSLLREGLKEIQDRYASSSKGKEVTRERFTAIKNNPEIHPDDFQPMPVSIKEVG
jgi:peptide/nickel transport system permease protein